MPAEDQNREEANLQSTNGNHSFDELAKGLATGSFSRGQALRWIGAALLGGALASVPGLAFAHHKPDHYGGPPQGEQGCPAGKVRVGGQCVCAPVACGGGTVNPDTCQCLCPPNTALCDGSCLSTCTPTPGRICPPEGCGQGNACCSGFPSENQCCPFSPSGFSRCCHLGGTPPILLGCCPPGTLCDQRFGTCVPTSQG